MCPSNLAQLIADLRRDEGVRYTPYNDTMGIPTVGVGHNLKANPLPDVWSYPLTDDQVNQLLTQDLQSVFGDLNGNLPWWTDLNDVRQRALCNFVFQLGITKALGFTRSLPLIRQGNYGAAADAMLQSAWASQVPNRAKRITDMIRYGCV